MAYAPISEELTALKKRARRRLVGAIALVLMALVVLWTVMDDRPPQSLVNESVAIVSSTPSLADAVSIDPVPLDKPLPRTAGTAPEIMLVPPAVPATQVSPPPVVKNPAPTVDASPSQHPLPAPPTKKATEKKIEASRETLKRDPARLLAGLEEEMLMPKAAGPVAKNESGLASRFFLQIGAFADVNKATALQTKAKEMGIVVHTEAVKTEKGKLTRLRAGPFDSRELAEKAQDKLALGGVDSSIVGK